MINVKDIIADVVATMKPTIAVSAAVVGGSGATVIVFGLTKSETSRLYMTERVKLTYSTQILYGIITTITDNSIVITLPINKNIPPTAIDVVLNYRHGHPIEIVNEIQQASQHDTKKYEAFPSICLFQDIKEDVTFERKISCNLVILQETLPEYSAANRYTYTFDPCLIPLYELFLKQLAESEDVGSIDGVYFKHTKYDRLFWGKYGLYGNATNIFNDYVDAIEIENLEFKIINC